MKRHEWLDLARKLNWTFSYVEEEEVFPRLLSGEPWLAGKEWEDWDEPYKTTYAEYVMQQYEKDASMKALQQSLGNLEDYQSLPPQWVNALKLYGATFSLAEFAAVIGNLRAARFGRDSAWRQMSVLGALDELRHTQIPLLLMHNFLKWDGQFDWTQRFYHSNNWVAIAGRHLIDELLITSNPIEFGIATNFVFETAFTNLQFVGLSSMAHDVRDRLFEKMINSIQSDEARHAQIGLSVLARIAEEDRDYAQFLLDKWFWRSWIFFAIVTGISMDYLTPLEARRSSFKEFVQEWIIDQFLSLLQRFGLKRPWYWETFLEAVETYHHMIYVSAYTYRATVWFDFILPSPEERAWLQEKYPRFWPQFQRVWEQVDKAWTEADPDNDMAVHGTAIIGFCSLCQVVLAQGTPERNNAVTHEHEGKKYIFCSQPCQWIFEKNPELYKEHKDIVKRVLEGEAPGNVAAMIRQYFDLDFDTWGKDIQGGRYSWLSRRERGGEP